MRAREPDREGDRNRDGVRLHYGVFGSGEPTLVLVPSNPIVHSRQTTTAASPMPGRSGWPS